MQADLTQEPSIVALAPERESLLARTASLKIVSAADYTLAAGWLKSIKGFLKAIEDARVKITKPINEGLRNLNGQAADASAPFLQSERRIKQAMIEFSDEQDRIRAEEQRKANDAAEKERLRLQEIADRAAAKGQESKAEAFQERASSVVAPVTQRAAPAVSGISVPKVWTFDITDPALIPREFLSVDESKIRRVVMAMKGDTRIAGVRVYEQKRIASSAA